MKITHNNFDQRDPLGWNIFNVVNFENSIYMKLYNLLILTENTKKSKNNFKSPKKSEIVICPGRILPCKQNKSAIYSTLHHIFPRLGRKIKAIAANWCLIVRTWGDTPAALMVCSTLGRRHQLVAQCCATIQPSFRRTHCMFGLCPDSFEYC